MEAGLGRSTGGNSGLHVTEDLFDAGQAIFDQIDFLFTGEVRKVPLSTAFDTPTIDRKLGLVSVAREAFDQRLWCDRQSANYGN